jgi:hypothetical protein
MSEETYNGWTNRETWATNLHLDNDQYLYETAREYAKQELEGHDEGEEINPYYFGERLRSWVEDDLLTLENIAGNQGLWLMLTDIGSLYRVNWREIATYQLDQAREEASV